MNQFPVIEDCLQVGGRAITDIALEAGGAPFYVYDRQLMTKRMAEMRS